MILKRVDVKEQLLKVRNKRIDEDSLLNEVQRIIEEDNKKDEEIVAKLDKGKRVITNSLNVDLLETDRIFHISHIEKICIDYRLRFLDTKFFKPQIPYEAIAEIKALEKEHQTSLEGFKIVAPSKLFKLENADDPLLFAPIGNGYHYLIHKWGDDLNPLRKFKMWFFKYFENLMVLITLVSLGLTALIPTGLFAEEHTTTEFIMIFFFMFKWVAAVTLYYGFATGKNFNSAIWKSKYYNA
ncbi:hypothetical protein GCM10009117_00090 [Gangjinia marincola]|uniref:Uncharacterized protein n=1 Tax=Gangjinia marincola TaxID=578463 RepID=A0ABN1MCN6_9FLAO